MSYPEPPRTDWAGLPILSDAADPEEYRDVWGTVLDDEAFQTLKAQVLEMGLFADRPASAPFDGAKYHALDVNVVFEWDADAGSWRVLNTGTESDPVPGTMYLTAASVEEAPSESTDVARNAEISALDAAKADTPHAIGGDDHGSSTLAALNGKVSDATLPAESDVSAVDHDHTGGSETTVPVDGLDMVSVVVDDPDRLPAAELDTGESIEIPIPVADGETLNVYRWGAFDAADHTAPTGLDVELVDGADTVQAAANTTNTQDTGAPVASYQNTSGSTQVFKLRAKNDTGSAIGDTDTDPGVGSHFGYRVV